MDLLSNEFLIYELNEFLPVDIYKLFHSSKMYQQFFTEMRLSRYWTFKKTYSYKYYCEYDENQAMKKHVPSWLYRLEFPSNIPIKQTFNKYINGKINSSKQLCIRIANVSDFM